MVTLPVLREKIRVQYETLKHWENNQKPSNNEYYDLIEEYHTLTEMYDELNQLTK